MTSWLRGACVKHLTTPPVVFDLPKPGVNSESGIQSGIFQLQFHPQASRFSKNSPLSFLTGIVPKLHE